MYGWGYAQIPMRRDTGDPVSDAVLIVDDGVGDSRGGYAVRQFNMNTPIARRFYPASTGTLVDDSNLIENASTLPALIPTPVLPITPANPNAQPDILDAAHSVESFIASIPWWGWVAGGGAILFMSTGKRGRR